MKDWNLTTSLSRDYVVLNEKMRDLKESTVQPGDYDMLLAWFILGILFTGCLMLW